MNTAIVSSGRDWTANSAWPIRMRWPDYGARGRTNQIWTMASCRERWGEFLLITNLLVTNYYRYYYDKKIMFKLHGKRYAYRFNIDEIKGNKSSDSNKTSNILRSLHYLTDNRALSQTRKSKKHSWAYQMTELDCLFNWCLKYYSN